MQYAIESISYPESLLVRFNVNVARSESNGTMKQAIHLLDNRAICRIGEWEPVECGHLEWMSSSSIPTYYE